MPETCETLVDFITGKEVPNIGAEENRQAVARFLVEKKGYGRGEIEVDAEIRLTAGGETYRSQLDLVVSVAGTRFAVVKCAAGSLESWGRETLAAARLLDRYRLPLAAVSDGRTALLFDTLTGRRIGEGMEAIPSRAEAREILAATRLPSSRPSAGSGRASCFEPTTGNASTGLPRVVDKRHLRYSPATSLPQCLQILARRLMISAQNGHSRVKWRSWILATDSSTFF